MKRMMEYMTVDEIRQGLTQTQTVIVPMGVIEQHGYHLPLNTDVYNCYETASRVSEITGCFVAPPINYSFSGGELPGTFNIHPATLSLYLYDILRSLVVMGFKNIVVLLGHAGSENEEATKNAVDMYMRLNPHVKDVVFAFMPFTKLSTYAAQCFAEKDFHAGYYETSLMLYWHPEWVRRDKMVTDKASLMALFREDQDAYQVKTKPFDHEFVFPYIQQHPEMAVGVMGYPERASAAFGEKVCQDIVGRTCDFIRKLNERQRTKIE